MGNFVSPTWQFTASPLTRLLQHLPAMHHGNWVPYGPRLSCRGSRSRVGPQRCSGNGYNLSLTNPLPSYGLIVRSRLEPDEMQCAWPSDLGIRPGTHQSNLQLWTNNITALWCCLQQRLGETPPTENTGRRSPQLFSYRLGELNSKIKSNHCLVGAVHSKG